MKIYLVGGAVRDELLGKTVQEKDWVVVGSTPEAMLAKGFQPVGKDFPVFLHPKTHEEYALARTERKTGKGYKGFHFYATPEVTLEEDLVRRDLTINAMAKSTEGQLIDPYGGKADLEKHLFRHVSPAFAEDPVRILRVARFASMLTDFHVHPDTLKLMKKMVTAGETNALVAERVWKELSRALIAKAPVRFFEILTHCGALVVLFPELESLASHLDRLNAVSTKTANPMIRFTVFLHGLSANSIKALCARFRVPADYTELSLLLEKYWKLYEALDTRSADAYWGIIKCCDGFRRAARFEDWTQACAFITQKDHRSLLHQALSATKTVSTDTLLAKNLKGQAFADALKALQILAIKQSMQL